MNFLDSKAMRHIMKQSTGAIGPFAVECEGHVIVTDGAFLLEWPTDQVERECRNFQKLLSNQEHAKTRNAVLRLQDRPWQDLLEFSAPDIRIFEVAEVEPDPEERAKMARAAKEAEKDKNGLPHAEYYRVYVQHRGRRRFHYSTSLLALVEDFIEDPIYRMYVPANAAKDSIMRMMAVFEGKKLVGALANMRGDD